MVIILTNVCQNITWIYMNNKQIPNPLSALETSLQMEFEMFAQYDLSDDILKAKKRQLELIRSMYKPITHTIVHARRADKPMGGPPPGFTSTMISVKEIINQVK